jgi:Hereditary spastic paraplegia protein strumpellin
MVEAVALLGGLLLLLDRRVPGLPRERSVVAYFRARGGAQVLCALWSILKQMR